MLTLLDESGENEFTALGSTPAHTSPSSSPPAGRAIHHDQLHLNISPQQLAITESDQQHIHLHQQIISKISLLESAVFQLHQQQMIQMEMMESLGRKIIAAGSQDGELSTGNIVKQTEEEDGDDDNYDDDDDEFDESSERGILQMFVTHNTR